MGPALRFLLAQVFAAKSGTPHAYTQLLTFLCSTRVIVWGNSCNKISLPLDAHVALTKSGLIVFLQETRIVLRNSACRFRPPQKYITNIPKPQCGVHLTIQAAKPEAERRPLPDPSATPRLRRHPRRAFRAVPYSPSLTPPDSRK